MKLRTQALFPLGVLTLLAALTFWLENAVHGPEARKDGKNRHDPDFIVENFTLKRFNAEGNLQHTLRAVKMIHYPDDDTTTVDQPDLAYTGGAEPARARAKQALVSPDGEQVVLVGDVVAVREAGDQGDATTLTTSVLTVFPDDEISRTGEPVTITRGRSVIHGVGLEANNLTGIASLLGQVRGTIEPNRKPADKPDNAP